MSTTTARLRTFGERRSQRLATSALTVVVIIALTATTAPAAASWSSTGTGSALAVTATLPPPVDVDSAVDSSGTVSVDWTTIDSAVRPHGFVVTRHSDGSVVEACGSDIDHLLTGSDCVDPSVPDGEYSYVVTAVFASWTARSAPSAPVHVSTPLLGAARSYSVLAGTSIVSTGATSVSGDVGVSPGTSITGFGPGIMGGDLHAGDDHAARAHAALAVAYDDLSTRPVDAELVGDLGGLTLLPGTYHSSAALALTGTLTLDGGGNADAVFVIRTNAAFDTAASSLVILANGVRAENVYWVVAGAAGTGAGTAIVGTIVAVGAITLGSETELIGRALSLDAVTLAANTIRFTATSPPTITIYGGTTAVTRDTTPTFAGSSDAAEGSPITVTADGVSWSSTVGSGGEWSVSIGPLPAGEHEITAKVRDLDGNGASAIQSLTIEVNPERIDVGSAATYSVLSATSVVNTGSTQLSGDLGVGAGGAITGFPPGVSGGAVHTGDTAARQALLDLTAAFDDGSSRTAHTEIVGDLGGRSLSLGVHHSTAALTLTGTLTLDAKGDPAATFIFQSDAAFTTAAGSTVVLAGGAQASNVFWVVGGAVGTGANSSLIGTVLARGAITLGAATALTGAALSSDTITLDTAILDGTSPAPVVAAASMAVESSTASRFSDIDVSRRIDDRWEAGGG